MNVIQRPDAQEFCATMKDYIIDTDSTITFSVQYGGQTILEEEYTPDNNFQVKIRRLGEFCAKALWGAWCETAALTQASVSGTFTFLIGGVQDAQSYVIFSRMVTKKSATAPGWLSEVREKVTRDAAKEYASALFLNGDKAIVAIRTEDGIVMTNNTFYSHTSDKAIVTLDISPGIIFPLFPTLSPEDIVSYEIIKGSDVMKVFIDHNRYLDQRQFRFKNVYDVPETLTTVGALSLKGNNESETASMYGIERKFGVKVTDEYTANSGVILLPSAYKLWHNMLNTQEVQMLIEDSWHSIIITKQSYEREFIKGALKSVEFNFNMADTAENNLISYD